MATTVTTIFSSALGQTVLAFLLVFTLVFAVLQKSKILGDGKKQIDALVALAIGLLVISVGYALDLITKLAPFLAVGLVIILVFLLLTSFFQEKELKLGSGLQVAFGILAFIAVVIAVLYFTDAFSKISSFFSNNGNILGNIILVIIVAGAIWFVLGGKGDNK